MYLKFEHDKPEGWTPEHDANGRLVNQPPLAAVRLVHTGTSPEQHFSRNLVDAALLAGWMSLSRGQLTLHTTEEDLVYTIVRVPGQYCCHCEVKLDDDPTGASGKAHIEEAHAGEPSPDPANPMGFRQANAYECVLDEAQHAVWSAAAVQARRAGDAPEAPSEYDPRQARQRKRAGGNGAPPAEE